MAILIDDKVLCKDKRLADTLRQKGFGEQTERELVFDLFEALYLQEKEKFAIADSKSGNAVLEEDLIKYSSKKVKNFYLKYQVFRDLRGRGFVVKTGFKFGFDFRVYPRGKKPGEAHSQWCINVTAQDDKYNFIELSRMVRLAGNLKTKLLNAVVDSENEINYYVVERVTP
ncbi:MAG TPA: tRNA-intron lyase [Candidatus Diapherotrites archaeon]|uniref:tRNA-intron lyase n=1 Tax=Candidatus Iainarchaeum sp. TaxID=3101447 RepID=A0A7J4IVI4_9ARCH|nr:tRNA-intron lyase [Candidatus Diapherotrites archaeon]